MLEIFFPILFYLNDLIDKKDVFLSKKTYLPFENFIKNEELEKNKISLEKKRLISQINLLFFSNNNDLAYNKIKELQKLPETEAYTNYFFAIWESKQENYISAINYLNTCLKYNPNFDPAWNLYGFLQSKAGNLELALDAFKKATSLEPYHPVYRYNLARIYWLLNNDKEALREIDKLIELRDNFPEAYYLKGMILEKSNIEESLNQYHQALIRNFNHEEFLIRFFNLSLKHNKTEYLTILIEKTQNLLNQEIMILRFQTFLQYGEYKNSLYEFYKIILHSLNTQKDLESHYTTLLKAQILNCYYKKDIYNFLLKNKTNLSEYKTKFIETILGYSCNKPLNEKDPLVNPAL